MEDKKSYTIVTASYWGFTITDGALRMLVLLHFHALGYTPIDLAFLFLLYEAMGIITNFFGGWIGARFGLRSTLFAGLGIQIIALLMLSQLPDQITVALSVIYIMASQALSGIAKDLTKMSSKSAVKLLVPEENDSLLFKWVALLTGSKNALKGFGFFTGGFLLSTTGFNGTLFIMAGALTIILTMAVLLLRAELGKAKTKIRRKDLFSKSREINYLSAARIFLFASRDIWFVVGVPVFLSSTAGWSTGKIGAFMAIWVIGYGIVQTLAPQINPKAEGHHHSAKATVMWGTILAIIPALITVGVTSFGQEALFSVFKQFNATIWLVSGLVLFGGIFAINSALHSYLIIAYSGTDKVSLNVGFYYMANAVGRFTGTLLSGVTYQYYGLAACLITSSLMIIIAVLLTLPLTIKPALLTAKEGSQNSH